MDFEPANATLAVTMSSFPGERMVAAVSHLVSEFCRALVQDQDVADRFHMAAQELAENLVKYSSGATVSLTAELFASGGDAVLELVARNHTTTEQLKAVERKLVELTTAPDPVEFYDRLIRETAPHADGSGLGLARIRAEGEFDVDYKIEGSELTISVRASVHPPKA
jgi:hypothetical protein